MPVQDEAGSETMSDHDVGAAATGTGRAPVGSDLGSLLLMRHGTSTANVEGRTAGWQDVDLASTGADDASAAARAIVDAGIAVEVVHASVLTRTVRTSQIVADALGLDRKAIHSTWRLNERHAGAFEGMTREEMVAEYGRGAVRSWKRSPVVRPPQLDPDDPRHPRHDSRYAGVSDEHLPSGESSLDVLERVLPYWEAEVVADLRARKTVLVVTHEHVLRVLMAHLSGDFDVVSGSANVPNRIPWQCRLRAGDGQLLDAVELAGPVG